MDNKPQNICKVLETPKHVDSHKTEKPIKKTEKEPRIDVGKDPYDVMVELAAAYGEEYQNTGPN